MLLLLSVISTGLSLIRRCVYIAFSIKHASNRIQTRGPRASHSSLDLKTHKHLWVPWPWIKYSLIFKLPFPLPLIPPRFWLLWSLPNFIAESFFLFSLLQMPSHMFSNIWKDFRDYLIQPFNAWINKIKAIETLQGYIVYDKARPSTKIFWFHSNSLFFLPSWHGNVL